MRHHVSAEEAPGSKDGETSTLMNDRFASQAADHKRRKGKIKGQDGFDVMVFGSL
jgi:hypothetical protein